MTAHKKVHKKSVDQTCKKCSKVFWKKDYFDAHLKHCIGYNNDEFDSSSERPSFVDVSLVIDPLGQPTFEPSNDSSEDQNEINLEEPVSQFSESSLISLYNPRNEYFKKYQSDTRKVKAMNLESIIQNLSSPVNNKSLRNINHSVNDILTNTSCDSYYQAKVCESFLQTAKKLNLDKKYKEFHTLLHGIFSEEQLVNISFLKWLSQKLNTRTQRFIETVKNWHMR